MGDSWSQLISAQKQEISKERTDDQKAVDKALLSTLKKDLTLRGYLTARFSLGTSDRPHRMVF